MPDENNEPGASWWAALEEFKASVETRLEKGDTRMTAMQAGINENTRLTKETKEKADEIYEFLQTMKSLLKLGNMLSAVTIKIWKPISYVAAAALSIVMFFQALKGGK